MHNGKSPIFVKNLETLNRILEYTKRLFAVMVFPDSWLKQFMFHQSCLEKR